MRNGNYEKIAVAYDPVAGSYPTYEEWKPFFTSTK